MAEVNVPNKPTATVTVTPKHASSISSSGSVTIVKGDTIKDVSLFAICSQLWYSDSVYVKAPEGMLKTTDKVIFARYITNKTRPRVNGSTDKSKPRHYYRGWIRPRVVNPIENFPLWKGNDDIKLHFLHTDNGYDFFELWDEAVDEPLLTGLFDWSYDVDGEKYPKVKGKKLGVKIERDGKTIVDYMPFSIFYSQEDDKIRFVRL